MNRAAALGGLAPSGLTTVTLTVEPPDGPGGTRATNEVAEATLKDAEAVPNLTAVAPEKSEPDTVTSSPPLVGPLRATIPVTCGDTKVYRALATAALVPPAVPEVDTVTVTWDPVPTSGVVTVTDVGVCAVTIAAAPPKWTVGTPVPNPLPVMNTVRPPVAGPELGLSPVTAGQPALEPVRVPSNAPPTGVPQPLARS